MKGRHYINGDWTDTGDGKIEVINPATGEVVGSVPNGGEQEATTAIEAAALAFPEWSKTTAYHRAELLMKWHDLLLEHKKEIGEILTKEMGKPLSEAIGEVEYSASFVSWFAEEGKRMYGRTIPASKEGKRIQINKQPVGVVVSITPWNFPAAMMARKMAPALAAGCTFVAKPAKMTPLTAVKMYELAIEAGFPKGVINLVTGSASKIGKVFTSHPDVRKLTFTGSTEIGKELMKQASETMLNLSLELGGHAPIIVLEDADMDLAIEGVMASKFRNAGQTCVCGNRIYVQQSIVEKFSQKLKQAAGNLKVGNGLEEGVQIGPLVDKDGYDKVQKHVDDAIEKGAKVLVGGNGRSENNAYFYNPTVLVDATSDMLVMNEETFGPVAPIMSFETDEEAVKLANDTRFGLAAYFFTESMSRGTYLSENLDYGIVGWNDGAPSTAQAPFGGMKESGVGREGGQEGLDAFLETKYVSIKI
ncbi:MULTISPECIES: NAD-dependent succinate-semialdehyde dehydrogenase [Planococcus]|uniref:Succinate-semialdehyde dehydrogenase (NADP(+)) n=1 Tax=Planococcus faecalis TaxID=1598147 RepID=A0ABN4XSE7_9BACL|nr:MULTISPECIES: NAD-dependent succinate-semialdehyde dehydrogenase [Planococcus]AQU80089.1 succinate-semialdehyde dehydrogenase (NADP(+)) [Planococcus faecalis]MDJ0330537.1 NAD-dependent succinate-semialdehyde dehydrogenase [Planococcus sp. S3-L1]OHX52542.1 succinate-semialdehyde dehydrogenase (NADP(+)) [Planococcus faecalis]